MCVNMFTYVNIFTYITQCPARPTGVCFVYVWNMCAYAYNCIYICKYICLMIAFITCNSNLVPLLEGLCSSNPCRFEFSIF